MASNKITKGKKKKRIYNPKVDKKKKKKKLLDIFKEYTLILNDDFGPGSIFF